MPEDNIQTQENKSAEENKSVEALPEDDLKTLIKKNLELTEAIYEMTKSVKNFVIWQRVLGVLKLLIIVIPIILGIIYLPPLLEKAWEPYRQLLELSPLDSSGQNSGSINLNNLDPTNLPKEVLELLK